MADPIMDAVMHAEETKRRVAVVLVGVQDGVKGEIINPIELAWSLDDTVPVGLKMRVEEKANELIEAYEELSKPR